MLCVIERRVDGGVSIHSPNPARVAARIAGGMTEQQATLAIKALAGADPSTLRVVDHSEIPTDREFRDAWKHDLTVDLAKAKAIFWQRYNGLRLLKARRLLEREALGDDVSAEREDLLTPNPDLSKIKSVRALKTLSRRVLSE